MPFIGTSQRLQLMVDIRSCTDIGCGLSVISCKLLKYFLLQSVPCTELSARKAVVFLFKLFGVPTCGSTLHSVLLGLVAAM